MHRDKVEQRLPGAKGKVMDCNGLLATVTVWDDKNGVLEVI